MMGRTLAIPIYKALLCFVIYTAKTEAKLAAMQAEGEGGFNTDSLPSSDEEDDSSHKGSGWALEQIVGVAVGAVMTVSLSALLVGVAVYVRWHRSGATPLLTTP